MYYRDAKIILPQCLAEEPHVSEYLSVWMEFILIHSINRSFIHLMMNFNNLIIPADAKIHGLYKPKMGCMSLLIRPGIIRFPDYPSLFPKTFFTGRKKGRLLQRHITIVFW